MPLTPEDVSNKRFTPVRLREGYDMGEVDQFLDEVEAELARLLKENEDLRSKRSVAGEPAGKPAQPPATGKDATKDATKTDTSAKADGDADKVDKAPAAAPKEEIKVVTAAEASSAATRLLELATRNADEVVAEAREEATEIVGKARTEAEQLEADTKTRTEELEKQARTRAQNLDAETEAKRRELLGDMEREKSRLDGEVDNLRAFEREYRSRLKSYFTQQLQALDGTGEAGELPTDESGDGSPKRLKAILGDGQAQDGQSIEGPDKGPQQG